VRLFYPRSGSGFTGLAPGPMYRLCEQISAPMAATMHACTSDSVEHTARPVKGLLMFRGLPFLYNVSVSFRADKSMQTSAGQAEKPELQ
jgi:hypothetical protein